MTVGNVLLCMSVKNGKYIANGSLKEKCSNCKQEVWITKASIARKDELKAVIMCEECVDRVAETHTWDLTPTPEQREEMKYIKKVK